MGGGGVSGESDSASGGKGLTWGGRFLLVCSGKPLVGEGEGAPITGKGDAMMRKSELA